MSISITPNVEFDTIAREWRCKWSADDDKSSLVALQETLKAHVGAVKAVDGVTKVQRVVCGGCLDFKVITSLPVAQFKAWEAAGFAPEAAFLQEIKAIKGVSVVETQTYTLMDA